MKNMMKYMSLALLFFFLGSNVQKIEAKDLFKCNYEFNEQIASYHDIHEGKITTDDSTIDVYVVPTDEEVMIARDAFSYAKENK